MKKVTMTSEDLEPPSTGEETESFPYLEHLQANPKVRPLRRVPNAPKFRCSRQTSAFRKRFYPDASLHEWNDWRWQLRNRIRDIHSLRRLINLSEDEQRAISLAESHLPLTITPYYASLIDRDNPDHPIRRTVVPVTAERIYSPGEAEDPLGEFYENFARKKAAQAGLE